MANLYDVVNNGTEGPIIQSNSPDLLPMYIRGCGANKLIVHVNGIIFIVSCFNDDKTRSFDASIEKVTMFELHDCTYRFVLLDYNMQGQTEQMQYILNKVAAIIIALKQKLMDANDLWNLVDKETANPKNKYDVYDYIQNARNLCDEITGIICDELCGEFGDGELVKEDSLKND